MCKAVHYKAGRNFLVLAGESASLRARGNEDWRARFLLEGNSEQLMKHVVSAGSRRAEPRTTAIDFIYRHLAATQPDATRSTGSSAALIVLGLIYTCLVGWVDRLTPHGLDLQFLYLLGCALIGWKVGAQPALGIALLS